MFQASILSVVIGLGVLPSAVAVPISDTALVNNTYEGRIRLNGKMSTTQVKASDVGQAKKLLQAQFGPSVTALSARKVG